MAWRVCSLISNLTGRPVFFCRTVARSAVYPLAATSSTRMATTSQPRSLLSIAKLNMERSRARPSIWSFVRIDQTCFGRRGGLRPGQLPLVPRHWPMGARGPRSLDPAWSYSSAWLQRARSMCLLIRHRNQVGFRTNAHFASGSAANDLWRLTPLADKAPTCHAGPEC